MTAFCLIEKVVDLTGWTDSQVAEIVGLSRSTVQAYRSGRLPEYLDGQQIHNLMTRLHLWRVQMIAGVEELDMLT